MIAALALIAAAQGLPTQAEPRVRAGGPGPVVLLGRAFALEAELARDLVGLARAGDVVRLSVGRSAETAAEPLAHSGVEVARIVLDPAADGAGDGRDLAAQVRAARCIELAGGEPLDWWHLLLPGGAPSRLGLAVREAHAAGAPVLGAGPAACFLGQWVLVDRTALARTARNPRERDEGVLVEGLGLWGGSLLDAATSEHKGAHGLVRTAAKTGSDLALFLDGDVVWITEPHVGGAYVSGSGAVLCFDLARARRVGNAVREGRVSLLSGGDRWHPRGGVQPGARTPLRCTPAGAPGELARGLDAAELRRILASDEPCGVYVGAELQLSIAADEDSFAGASAGGRTFGACGLRFDLEWLER